MPATKKWVEIKAQTKLRSLLRDYFLDLDAASRDPARRVAWCSSVGPCEILVAFGYATYFPENHGALIGARKVSHKYIPYAVNAGYCAESCSYMNSDIGAALAGHSPLQEAYGLAGPPDPEVLVYSTNQCREVQDWWKFFGRRRGAPVFGVRPPSHLGAVTSDMVRYVRSQLLDLIQRIGDASGRRFSFPKLEEVVHLSSRASQLWNRVLDTARVHPSPLTFFDGLIHMAPVVVMRGSQAAIDYYETLLAEMRQRIHDGVGAIPEERHRL
jgi:benzoyl-CoA reductase/2-hydroxyglutaryl-CoA dehydratase subunit BcrC/BadD/HgdB